MRSGWVDTVQLPTGTHERCFCPMSLHRHASGLAHQIVHRCAEAQRHLVPHVVEGVGTDVTVDRFLGLRVVRFSETDEAVIGMDHVDRACDRPLVVVELGGDPIHVRQGNAMDLNLGDFHGSGIGASPIGSIPFGCATS